MTVAESTIHLDPPDSSQGKDLAAREGGLLLFLYLFCGLVAVGLPLRDVILFSGIGVVLVIGGASIYSIVLKQRSIGFAEMIGAGIATATIIQSLTSFIVGELGYRGLWDNAGLILLFAVFPSFLRQRMGYTISVGQISSSIVHTVALVVFLSYQAWSPLLLPYIVGMACCLFALSAVRRITNRSSETNFRRNIVSIKYSVLAPLAGLVAQVSAIQIWNLRRPYDYFSAIFDNVYDEGFSWSISKLGYSENPFFNGHEIVGYFLTNAWAGDLIWLLDSTPFSVVSGFGPLITITATLFLSVAIVHEYFPKASFFVVILVGLQGSVRELFPFTEPPRIQQLLGMVWVLLLVNLVEKWIRCPKFLTAILTLPIMVAVLLGKTQMIMLCFLFWTLGGIFVWIKNKSLLPLAQVSGLLALGLGAYLIIYQRYLSYRSSPWIANFDPATLNDWLLPILLAVFTRTLFPFSRVYQDRQSSNGLESRAAIVAIVCSMAYAIFHDANAIRHVLTVALLLGGIALAPALYESTSRVGARVSFGVGFIGFCVGATLFYLRERSLILNLQNDSFSRVISVDSPSEYNLVAIICLAFLSTVVFRFAHRSRRLGLWRSLLSFVIVLAVGSNMGAMTSWTFRTELRGFIRLEKGETWPSNGTREMRILDVGSWIRNNTSQDSLLASNTLCRALPSVGVMPDFPTDWDCGMRNMSGIVTAHSRRTSYLDGPWQAVVFDPRLDIANQRYRDSILFATNNDPNSHARMTHDGVDYFVVDLGQTSLRDWEPRGTIRYQDEHYAVVELNN